MSDLLILSGFRVTLRLLSSGRTLLSVEKIPGQQAQAERTRAALRTTGVR